MKEEKYVTKKGKEINLIIDQVKDECHSDNYHSDDWSIAIAIKELGKRIEYKLSEEVRSYFSSDAVELLKTKFRDLSLVMCKIAVEKGMDDFKGGIRLIQLIEVKNYGNLDRFIEAKKKELEELVK